MSAIDPNAFTNALLTVLDETFDHVHGYYLDAGTSLFETLAGITAAEASLPAGGGCATLAAKVKHTAFNLDMVDKTVRDPSYPPVDWGEIWRTVSRVTPEEWDAMRAELRANYDRILVLVREVPAWGEAEMAGAIGMVAHIAYHLGEIRQALCTLRP